MKLVVKAGLRERKDTREKINALIDAQMRTEAAMVRLAQVQSDSEAKLAQAQTDCEARLARAQADSEARLTRAQASTGEKLNILIDTVDRVINRGGNGKS
jgi:hypothetical protein